MNFIKEKKIALYAIKRAGAELRRKFQTGDYTMKLKSKHEIVTNVDIDSNNLILEIIKKNFPTHNILSEETGNDKRISDFLWIVDPLDGTTNFFTHNPLFCVAIALVYKGDVVLSFVYAPMQQELFWAKKGEGAFLGNRKLKVSSQRDINKAFINYCHGYSLKSKERAISIYKYIKLNKLDARHFGSTSLELAYIASGRIDALFIPEPHTWDVAAGNLLVSEAGGVVNDFNMMKWNLESKGLIASNKNLAKEMGELIKRIK
jgi:myo-inositol-1(or 4)-monophosphatase